MNMPEIRVGDMVTFRLGERANWVCDCGWQFWNSEGEATVASCSGGVYRVVNLIGAKLACPECGKQLLSHPDGAGILVGDDKVMGVYLSELTPFGLAPKLGRVR